MAGAVPFDLEQLELTSPPAPVLENVRTFRHAEFSLSLNGPLAYIPSSSEIPLRRLVWLDRDGHVQPLPLEPRHCAFPRISPEGRRLAVSCSDESGSFDIWVADLPAGPLTRLTFTGGQKWWPIWTPDGRRIAYSWNRFEPGLYWKSADGTGAEIHLGDIWSIARGVAPVSCSPDGRWFVYFSDESGRSEIYVQPFPGPGPKRQVSRRGGWLPRWTQSGELFYPRVRAQKTELMAVSVTTGSDIEIGTETVLFEVPRTVYLFEGYDVAPDGQGFAMLEKLEDESRRSQVNVILNWTGELDHLVPSQRAES